MSEALPAANDPRFATLEVALERARLEVWTTRILDAATEGTRLAFRALLGFGLLVLVLGLAAFSVAAPVGGPGIVFAVVGALLVALIAFLVPVVPAAIHRPSRREAARALDAAAGTKDRIGAALEFLALGETADGFRRAAIEDGLSAAGATVGSAVGRSRATPLGRADCGLATLALLALVGGLLLPVRDLGGPLAPGDPVAEAEEEAPSEPGDGPAEVPRPAPTPDEGRPPQARPPLESETPSGATEASEASGSGAEPPSGERMPASGKPGKGRDVEARQARSTAASQGDPTQGDASKPPPEEEGSKPRKPRKKADETRVQPPRRDEEQKTGSTVGQSGSGGGTMSPVKSPWDQKDKSRDAPLPESAQDEDIEDEVEENEARGGTQPSLKDRRGATSRDLSISGKGEGGEGRGGPSQPKKSRGTASLILGVPMPDFVRGQLNPGTTKVTHERSEPVPTVSGPAPVRELVPREAPEIDVGPRGAPPHLADLIRRTLLRLRGARIEN